MPRQSKGETKAEVVTLRLTPKIRYGLEILARQQRRTLSSVAEWAFFQAFKSESIRSYAGDETTLEEAIDRLWDPLEPDRLVKLAQAHPSLLTYEEELIWKVIKEEPSFWSEPKMPGGLLGSDYTPPLPDMKRIRRLWAEITAAAKGQHVDFSKFN